MGPCATSINHNDIYRKVVIGPRTDHVANGQTTELTPVETKAEEVSGLVLASLQQLIPFIEKGEQERAFHRSNAQLSSTGTSLIHPTSLDPQALSSLLSDSLNIDDNGSGVTGFQRTLRDLLEFSVNPFAPGFLDKLYATPLAPGVVAELILAVLNSNLHVYQVSPVLTLIEKSVTKRLVKLFGLKGPRAGGISVTGGSASNLTSIVVARNSLYPETKLMGNTANGLQLVMFTSAHGHYSIEKAAQGLGFGTSAVVAVPTDAIGRMKPDELERLIIDAKASGKTPFYVNATAGTTVLGSFDQFEEISRIVKRHRCWLHIDGAWGGSFIFPQRNDFREKIKGIHLADSIGINPHKMLGVPVTCSILLSQDLRLLESAMTLKAGYLFHEPEDDHNGHNSGVDDDETNESKNVRVDETNGTILPLYDLQYEEDPEWTEPNDLADMTLQCGRRGDSLKFFMSWQYYGTAGYGKMIEDAYDVAIHMNTLVDSSNDLTLVLGPGSIPSCLQVCFYYTPNGRFLFGLKDQPSLIPVPHVKTSRDIGKQNTRVTSRLSKVLIERGFMVDYAPALEGQEDKGSFLRVVVNISTIQETGDRLISDVLDIGGQVVKQLKDQFANGV